MTNITDLSFELIDRILHFSEFSAYLQLALSCKHLAHYTQRTMAHHRECHALYTATSDISPETLPTLARALLHDPIAISHVRHLEFWGARSSWSDWKVHAIQQSDSKATEEAKADTSSMLQPAELDALQRLMQKELRLSEQASQHWRQKIEAGDDGPLKGMLIALCPNLEAARFVKYKGPKNLDDQEEERRYQHYQSCLEFLTAAIEAQYDDQEWSAGFLSLTRIAFGVPSRAVPKEADSLIFAHSALPLFRLPSLRSLYLNRISLTKGEQEEWDDDDLFTDRLPPGSSPNLRELIFGEPDLGDNGSASANLLNTMFDASKKLRHIAFQDGDISSFDFDQILGQRDKLRSILVYGDCGVNGYRSAMYYPDEACLPPTFTVDVSDIMLCAPWTEGKGDKGNGLDPEVDKVGRWGTSRSQFGEYIHNAFDNSSWEAIVIVGDPDEKEADLIDQGLAEFILRDAGLWDSDGEEDEMDTAEDEDDIEIEEEEEDDEIEIEVENEDEDEDEDKDEGGDGDGEKNENEDADDDNSDDGSIKADETGNNDDNDDAASFNNSSLTPGIYLEGIDGTRAGGPRWYAKTIEAGRETGLPVHTRTTPAPREHPANLPWPASDKELRTSPLYGHPDLEKYILKLHDGLVLDDCGNCGLPSCEKCLKVMDADAWAKVHKEERAYQLAKP